MTLLAEIEAFLAQHQMSPTAFGLDALNDPGFVPGLRAGRDPKLSTAERVRCFMTKAADSAEAAVGSTGNVSEPAASSGKNDESSPVRRDAA